MWEQKSREEEENIRKHFHVLGVSSGLLHRSQTVLTIKEKMLSQILLRVEFLFIQRYHQKSENEMHKMSYPTKYSYPECGKNF